MTTLNISTLTESNNIYKRSSTTTDLDSFQVCKGASTYANQSMWYMPSTKEKNKKINYLDSFEESI